MYEKLDIYDENRIKTGKIIERKEDIPLEKNELVLAVHGEAFEWLRWFIDYYYKIIK